MISSEERRKEKKVFNLFLDMLFSEEELDEVCKLAEEGNLPAKLAIILHNQRILNEKINTLLAYGKTKNTPRQSEAERTNPKKQAEEV